MLNKDMIRELYKQGFGYTDIGKRVGVTKQRVHQIIKGYHKFGYRGREEFYRNFGICKDCNEKPSEALHHLDFNNENDSAVNLLALCISCHAKRHKGQSHKYPTTRSKRLEKRNQDIKTEFESLKTKMPAMKLIDSLSTKHSISTRQIRCILEKKVVE